MTHVVLIDNHDSFVYNLVDAFAVAGYRCSVFRNTVEVATIMAAEPDLICLSPGPGHPRDAGVMMELIDAQLGTTPILGICLGFQALLEHFGGTVEPCGPVHGTSDDMVLTNHGVISPLFSGLATDSEPDRPDTPGRRVPIARYHSLGCVDTPTELLSLSTCTSAIGDVVMAAQTPDGKAIGLQFHPESVLSPTGPIILSRCVEQLLASTA